MSAWGRDYFCYYFFLPFGTLSILRPSVLQLSFICMLLLVTAWKTVITPSHFYPSVDSWRFSHLWKSERSGGSLEYAKPTACS